MADKKKPPPPDPGVDMSRLPPVPDAQPASGSWWDSIRSFLSSSPLDYGPGASGGPDLLHQALGHAPADKPGTPTTLTPMSSEEMLATNPAAVAASAAEHTGPLPGPGATQPKPPPGPAPGPAPGTAAISAKDLAALLSGDQASAMATLHAMFGDTSPGKAQKGVPRSLADIYARNETGMQKAFSGASDAQAQMPALQAVSAILRGAQMPKSALQAAAQTPTSLLGGLPGNTQTKGL